MNRFSWFSFILIGLLFMLGAALDSGPRHQAQDGKETGEPLWVRHSIGDIELWVALNSLEYQGQPFQYRSVWVLLDPARFTKNDLRIIFADLGTEYKIPSRLRITVFSDKDLLHSEVRRYHQPKPNIDYRPIGPSDESSNSNEGKGRLAANYYRSEEEEFFNFRANPKEPEFTTVVIRQRTIRYTGEPRSDLLVAAKEGDTDTVIALLRSGADPNTRDATGATPLMQASLRCRTEAVEKLLAGGADVNVKDEDGDTALTNAASNGCTKVVQALIRKGADVNAQNNNGYSALLLATAREQVDTVKALLANRARVELANNQGETSLILARERRLEPLIELLIRYGAKR